MNSFLPNRQEEEILKQQQMFSLGGEATNGFFFFSKLYWVNFLTKRKKSFLMFIKHYTLPLKGYFKPSIIGPRVQQNNQQEIIIPQYLLEKKTDTELEQPRLT